MGENPLRSFPQPHRIRAAFESLEFLVVQDILLTETAKMADVVLPGAPFSEKGGSFTNLEGSVQTFGPAVSPLENAKPDWEILARLASKLGHPKRYDALDQIREEIAADVPMYEDLENRSGAAWIKENAPGHPLWFSPVVSMPKLEVNEAYPFTAILTTSRFHLGSGTRTGRSHRIQAYGLRGAIELSPKDGETLRLKPGDRIRIRSPWGALERESRMNTDLSPGLIVVPSGYCGNDAMNLIGLTQPDESDYRSYRSVPVTLEPVAP
jgi:predicted molibdopterin-dependent oxidoreductase YjgC